MSSPGPARRLLLTLVAFVAVAALRVVRVLRWGRVVQSLWDGPSIINFAIQCKGDRSLGGAATSLVHQRTCITGAFDVPRSSWSANRRLGSAESRGVLEGACRGLDRTDFVRDPGYFANEPRAVAKPGGVPARNGDAYLWLSVRVA